MDASRSLTSTAALVTSPVPYGFSTNSKPSRLYMFKRLINSLTCFVLVNLSLTEVKDSLSGNAECKRLSVLFSRLVILLL